MRALREGKLLSEEMTKAILKPQVIDFEDEKHIWQYSYGIWFFSNKDRIIRMALIGEDPGVSARAYYYPEQNVEVVILSNIGDIAGELGKEIQDIVIGVDL